MDVTVVQKYKKEQRPQIGTEWQTEKIIKKNMNEKEKEYRREGREIVRRK